MDYLLFDDMAQCTETEVAQLLPLVSVQRREQALRYKHTFGQYTCLKSYLMLVGLLRRNQLLSATELPEFVYNTYGKPYIACGVEFSLSHCKAGIVVAIDTAPIGVDIEAFRHIDESLIRRTMNPAEVAGILSSAKPNVAFTRLWTQKEAVLKQRGTGIVSDLHNVLTTPPYLHLEVIERENYTIFR